MRTVKGFIGRRLSTIFVCALLSSCAVGKWRRSTNYETESLLPAHSSDPDPVSVRINFDEDHLGYYIPGLYSYSRYKPNEVLRLTLKTASASDPVALEEATLKLIVNSEAMFVISGVNVPMNPMPGKPPVARGETVFDTGYSHPRDVDQITIELDGMIRRGEQLSEFRRSYRFTKQFSSSWEWWWTILDELP